MGNPVPVSQSQRDCLSIYGGEKEEEEEEEPCVPRPSVSLPLFSFLRHSFVIPSPLSLRVMNFHPWRLRTKLGCSDSSSFPPIVKVGEGGRRTTKQSSNHAKGKPCLSLLKTSDDFLEVRKILSILCEYVTTEKKKKNFCNYAFLV